MPTAVGQFETLHQPPDDLANHGPAGLGTEYGGAKTDHYCAHYCAAEHKPRLIYPSNRPDATSYGIKLARLETI